MAFSARDSLYILENELQRIAKILNNFAV